MDHSVRFKHNSLNKCRFVCQTHKKPALNFTFPETALPSLAEEVMVQTIDSHNTNESWSLCWSHEKSWLWDMQKIGICHSNYAFYTSKWSLSDPLMQRCFNYSHVPFSDIVSVYFYIVILIKVPTKPLDEGVENVSWVEARKICVEHGGYLPVLKDQREMSHFVSILKFDCYEYRARSIPDFEFRSFGFIPPSPEVKEVIFIEGHRHPGGKVNLPF